MHPIRSTFLAFLLAAVTARAAVVNGDLTVDSFAAYAGQTNIVLQATGDVIFSGGTLNLPELPPGAVSGLLTVQAGNDVMVNDGVTIVGGAGWSVTMEAGITNFETAAASSGTGNITFLGNASLVLAGGSINLLAGGNITVAGGAIGTTGGNVFITTLGGSVSTGSGGQIGTMPGGSIGISTGGGVSAVFVGTITNLTAGGVAITNFPAGGGIIIPADGFGITNLPADGIITIPLGPGIPVDGGFNCPAHPGRVCPHSAHCHHGRLDSRRGCARFEIPRFAPPRH